MKKSVNEDVYYKKTLTFKAWKQSLQFKTSQELFSSHDVDTGTRQLLRTIVESDLPVLKKVLDLGCGYGPLGLTLKALHPASEVHLVDKDALALEYSRQNAVLNKLEGVQIYGSLGYDEIKSNDFDLIISNIPGKAGTQVIAYLLREASAHLSAGGRVAVVAVTPLDPVISQVLNETPGVEIILKREWAEHTVFHYRFSQPQPAAPVLPAVERGIYQREALSFRSGGIEYPMQTVYGLPDFNSLGNENDVLFYTLQKYPRRDYRHTLVYNPGQGHAAVIASLLFNPERITLADRDLLALKASRFNLALNHYSPQKTEIVHQLGMPAGLSAFDLAILALREEEGPAANLADLRRLNDSIAPDGAVIVTSSSTAVTRLVENLKTEKLFLVQARDRWRGQSLLLMKKRQTEKERPAGEN